VDTVADSRDAIRDFVDVAFCASRLGSVPGAASADRHDHLLMAKDLAGRAGGVRHPVRGRVRARGAAHARLRGSLARPGIRCDAALAGSAPAKARMAAANREFDQLSTMATALPNKLT
jgi:hypothetical protein